MSDPKAERDRLLRRAAKTKGWAEESESNPRVSAMLSQMESEPGIPLQPGDLDRDPWLFNCLDVTLDLQTSKLRSHCREDLITKRTFVVYDPNAECPVWLSFLAKIMEGNAGMIAFLQRAIGYSLTGSTREQCLFLLHGDGSNGKSTFLEVLRDVFGDYSQQANFETFIE